MPSPRLTLFPLMLLLALATSASARDEPGSPTVSAVPSQGFDQVVYKGVIGNVLDAIPMDPSKRLDLQRTNAVVGNTLLGRSLAILAGLSNPVLLLGGFAWGVWAASNIRQEDAGMKLSADPRQTGDDASRQAQGAARPHIPAAVDDPAEGGAAEFILVSSISDVESKVAALSHPHVVKIWPTQRPSIPPQ